MTIGTQIAAALPENVNEWSDDDKLIASLAVELYLAEHPADDDELLNTTWVEDMGLLGDINTKGLHLSCDYGRWVAWFEGTVMLCEVNTRGDVRRLCAALGLN